MQKRKNAALVTIFDDNNIGNRLQNYALQQVLTNYGVRVVTLDNGYTSIPNRKDIRKREIKGVLGKCGIQKYKIGYIRGCASENRRKANEQFDKVNIHHILNVTYKDAFARDWSEFDFAIAGSDQIWHKWRKDVYELPYYYLEFMPQAKRYSYAASFGFSSIPAENFKQHKTGLNEMHFISCREKTGCKIVQDVTGKEALRVLDPTLLLDAMEWRKVAEQAPLFAKNQTKYAFVYFLGKVTEEYRDFIDSTMKASEITNVIDFADVTNPAISQCGPSGFLSLIDKADYVFTDSFHCTVFSVLFHKNFHVFRRVESGFENMFDRLEDLLSSKGLLDRIYGGTTACATNDFDVLYKQSIAYLESIVNQ